MEENSEKPDPLDGNVHAPPPLTDAEYKVSETSEMLTCIQQGCGALVP